MNIKKTMTYGVKNPGSDLVQALTSGGVKPVNGIPTLPVTIIRYGIPTFPVTIIRYGIPTLPVTKIRYGIPTLPITIFRSPTIKQIQEMYKQNRKIHTDLFALKKTRH